MVRSSVMVCFLQQTRLHLTIMLKSFTILGDFRSEPPLTVVYLALLTATLGVLFIWLCVFAL